jgi:Tfp pilus assembly protein PilF/uncharacterized membrane protein YhaH (DUF805 family)
VPFVLLLLDYWPLGRFQDHGCRRQVARHCNGGAFSEWSNAATRLVAEKLPLLALAVVCCWTTVWSQGEAVASIKRFPFPWRMENAAVSYVVYLRELFCPVNLAVLYPRLGSDLAPWKVWAAVAVLAVLTTAATVCRRRCPYLLVGWLWYLGMLVPVIGLVQVGSVAIADRFTYLPQIGLAMALVWGAADLCRLWPPGRRLCGAASALVLAVLMVAAWRQTSFWRNGETLWGHAVMCTSNNAPAHINLGNAFTDQGRLDEAIVQYRRALRISPGYAEAHYNLGNTFAAQDRLDTAIAEYRQAIEINPRHAFAHANMAAILARQGRFAEAAAHFREALQLQFDHSDVNNNLAWLRATCPEAGLRNAAEAVTLAERANRLSGYRRADYLDTLAAAYAEAGRFPEALETACRAAELAEQQHQPALADALRPRIALYRAKKPYHAPPAPPAAQPPKR